MLALVGIFAIAGVLLMPVMLLAIIGLQALNPWSDDLWTRPTHRSNPFRLGNPLLLFHFAAYFAAASGLGVLVSSLWHGLYAAAYGALGILGAASVLVGVRLCMRVFKHKMAEEPLEQPSQQPTNPPSPKDD